MSDQHETRPAYHLFDLTGKVALVTGGSRGLGRGMADALAAAGAAVVAVSRTSEQLPCDVADIGALEQAIGEVVRRHGRLDVLLNAAGVQLRKPALDVTPEEFDYVTSVNLRAAYFASTYAARVMRDRGEGGKIIHVASLTTAIGLPNVSIYAAAKSGIAGLVRTMAVEWAPLGIQVNAIGPGYYRTELTEALFQDRERTAWVQSRIPMGRTGVPGDLAGAAVFLASRASDYITGQILYVDGGWLAG